MKKILLSLVLSLFMTWPVMAAQKKVMDLSLHLPCSNADEFVANVLKANFQVNFIGTTHSPGVVYQVWSDVNDLHWFAAMYVKKQNLMCVVLDGDHSAMIPPGSWKK